MDVSRFQVGKVRTYVRSRRGSLGPARSNHRVQANEPARDGSGGSREIGLLGRSSGHQPSPATCNCWAAGLLGCLLGLRRVESLLAPLKPPNQFVYFQ